MAPSIWGKMTTFTQLLSIALAMLSLAQWLTVPQPALQLVFVLTMIATVVSGAGYVVEGLRFYQASQTNQAS
jgi:phosphatidylglycerophosphate synthase